MFWERWTRKATSRINRLFAASWAITECLKVIDRELKEIRDTAANRYERSESQVKRLEDKLRGVHERLDRIQGIR